MAKLRSIVSPYWLCLLLLALAAAGWMLYSGSRPTLSCWDGHCPDPGSIEEASVLRKRAEGAPFAAFVVFAGILFLGTVVRAVQLSIRALRSPAGD